MAETNRRISRRDTLLMGVGALITVAGFGDGFRIRGLNSDAIAETNRKYRKPSDTAVDQANTVLDNKKAQIGTLNSNDEFGQIHIATDNNHMQQVHRAEKVLQDETVYEAELQKAEDKRYSPDEPVYDSGGIIGGPVLLIRQSVSAWKKNASR